MQETPMQIFHFFTLIFCLGISVLSAQLSDHFKKAEGKSEIHRIKNIDFIYLINLDQRPEKLASSLQQLHPYGIVPYRFSAVNGWELSLEAINDVGVKFSPEMKGGFMATSYLTNNFKPTHELMQHHGQTYFVHCMARGTIGIILSHLSVLQDAYDSEYETIWVMEDDIEVKQDPRMVSELIEKLDGLVGQGNWDVLYTDRAFHHSSGSHVLGGNTGHYKRPNFELTKPASRPVKISPDFLKIPTRYSTTSMIIRRGGMLKILDFMKTHQIYLPYDLDYHWMELRVYTTWNDVVTNQAKAISDNGTPPKPKKT